MVLIDIIGLQAQIVLTLCQAQMGRGLGLMSVMLWITTLFTTNLKHRTGPLQI